MKKLNLILGLFFVFTALYSQEISNQLVSPGGQTSKTSLINFDWSLGQIASTTINTSGGLITQGFQQQSQKKEQHALSLLLLQLSLMLGQILPILNYF